MTFRSTRDGVRLDVAEGTVMSHAEPRSVILGRHRTTVRLEPAIWDALSEIATREGRTVNQLCTELHERWQGHKAQNFTAALRRFVMAYFRKAATRAEPPEPGAGRATVRHALDAVGAPGPSKEATGLQQHKDHAPKRLARPKRAPQAGNTSATDSA